MFVAGAAVGVLGVAGPAVAGDYRQSFPYPRDKVYAALVAALPALGLKIREEDPILARVVAAAGVSAWSWGENLSIAVVADGEAASVLEFDSKRVLGTNIADGGRSLKLFNKIVFEVSRRLQDAPGD